MSEASSGATTSLTAVSAPSVTTSKTSTFFAASALVVALASAAGMAWMWYQWQPQWQVMQQQQRQLEQQQQQSSNVMLQKHDALQQFMQQQLTDVVKDWQEKQQAQAERQQTDLAALRQVVEQQSGNVKGWQLLEADYFLRLAEQKLFLEQNVGSTLQLLELAEKRLKLLQEPSLVVIREAINADKRMLAELNTPDMHQLHLTLSNLRQQSLLLPLRQSERAITTEDEQDVTEDAADWRQNLAHYWHSFWQGLVKVRASLPEDGVSLTAEQQISVRNTLMQQLLLAELAAMQHNQAVYAAAIQQSADSLQRYFAATEPLVQQMADDLVLLSALQVSLPQLAPLKSPEVFADYQKGLVTSESTL